MKKKKIIKKNRWSSNEFIASKADEGKRILKLRREIPKDVISNLKSINKQVENVNDIKNIDNLKLEKMIDYRIRLYV